MKTITEQSDGAFPVNDVEGQIVEYGLTKREFFAALSLQGILSNDEAIKVIIENKADLLETVALGAVKAADALIVELNK